MFCRGIDITAYNDYGAVYPVISIYNKRRNAWSHDWRFITPSSQGRLLRLMESLPCSASVSVWPMANRWSLANKDYSRIVFTVYPD